MEPFKPGRRLDPDGQVTEVYDENGNMVRMEDELGRITRAVYDSSNRMVRTILPEGNERRTAYDVRSNPIEQRQVAKPGSNQSDIVTTTAYVGAANQFPWQCANWLTCNRPSYERDAENGVNGQTDYSWSPTTGLLLSVTRPADDSGSRPVTSYGYTGYAGPDNSTFQLQTSVTQSIDATQSTTTTFAYDPANHFALREAVVAGTLRTCFRFDAQGNLISRTEPRGTCQ
jgi:YD repeat-containing protein